MKKRSRFLVLSSLIIATCLLMITIGTFALFTDNISIHHHLEAGTLNATLERTHLKYNLLENTGYLVEKENTELIDFSKTTTINRNIFDIDSGTLIVPGSFYQASLRLSNNGNVAFKYWIELNSIDEDLQKLASQIEITITTYNELGLENEYKAYLNEGLSIGNIDNPLGEIATNSQPVNFKVKITFIDNEFNNEAKNNKVNFDLTVCAVQVV